MIFATIHHVRGRQLVAHIWPTGEGPWTFNVSTVREDGQSMTWTELHPTRQAAQHRLDEFDRDKAVNVAARMLAAETRADIAVMAVRGEGTALQ